MIHRKTLLFQKQATTENSVGVCGMNGHWALEKAASWTFEPSSVYRMCKLAQKVERTMITKVIIEEETIVI